MEPDKNLQEKKILTPIAPVQETSTYATTDEFVAISDSSSLSSKDSNFIFFCFGFKRQAYCPVKTIITIKI